MRVPFNYLPSQFDEAETDKILAKMKPVIMSGDFTLGAPLAELESVLAERTGAGYAVGVSSGTSALFLSLKALGITGEVITSPLSFFATPASISTAGAQPVFADVRDDFNINPAAIEATITPRTEALVPVHWAGRPCNMTAIMEIARKHGLAVVEDTAQGFGAKWDGRHLGTFGAAGAVSFHPLKCLNVTGDAGLVLTSRSEVAERIKRLRNHGCSSRDVCEEWGWNDRMDTLQAAVALHVLKSVDWAIETRREYAALLDAELAGIDEIYAAPMPKEAAPNYYLYPLLCHDRDQLFAHLMASQIDCKVHYGTPLHLQPAAAKMGHSTLLPAHRMYKRGDFPMAEKCCDGTISLPFHPWLNPADLLYMADVIRAFYKQRKSVAAE